MRTSQSRIFRTLRFRLTLWNALTVVLTATIILLVLRAGVRFALLSELDKLLGEDVGEVVLLLQDGPLNTHKLFDALDQKARGHHHHRWFVVFFDTKGKLLWASENTPPELAASSPLAGKAGPVSINDFRVRDHRMATPVANVAHIRIGSSLLPIQQDMTHLDRQIALTAGLLFAIAPLLGYWLAGLATRPVGAMIQTASRLRPSRLDERLVLRGTGDELDQLAGTINGLLDRIAVHVERKQDFLANAAHDLRTPLASIRSSIEVALNEPRSPAEYQELLSEIIEASSMLESLVKQLLILSETEAVDPIAHAVPQPFGEIVHRSAEMFQALAESKGIALTCRAEVCTVVGNRDYLHQIVNNLIDNAVKFTPQGGKIAVELQRDEANLEAILRVSDTGRGIPRGELSHIFERFYRGRRDSAREDGTHGLGLGLSICQALTVAHGGRIFVDSEVGKGTRFTATFPLAQVDAAFALN